jgi:hypothetical protein
MQLIFKIFLCLLGFSAANRHRPQFPDNQRYDSRNSSHRNLSFYREIPARTYSVSVDIAVFGRFLFPAARTIRSPGFGYVVAHHVVDRLYPASGKLCFVVKNFHNKIPLTPQGLPAHIDRQRRNRFAGRRYLSDASRLCLIGISFFDILSYSHFSFLHPVLEFLPHVIGRK